MTAAFILMQMGGTGGMIDPREVHSALHAIAGVKTVHFLTGPTDIIAFVEAADQAALAQMLGKIRAVKGVASTDTRIVWSM